MMKRILLGVICLSGWRIFSSCLLHQYHYVADPMNWTEAQTYCRETYTDLATIESTEEMNQLISKVSPSGLNSEVWIGLYKYIDWRWSDNYTGPGADYRNWRSGSPGNYLCGMSDTSTKQWWGWDCSSSYPFVCNNGTQKDPKFVYVSSAMSWTSAQKYCREKFTDLATVRSDAENQAMHAVALSAYPWFGLHIDPNSYWSDASNSLFRHWEGASLPVGSMSVVCGVAALQNSGKWKFFQCETRLPFVCYSVPPPPVKRQIVKLRIKRGGSSVDLNDPAVKADILKQLQVRLTEKRMSGVTLKWREQPDGKVFHKEEESSRRNKRKKSEL
ncbi:C-type mannose receptor 2-like [Acanthopagrus latus]|uniref:C-type mannose receptor 2-like n=1 Tax=Acanthopagrus latus TaxID=8177 RepID=UPI00187BE78B|nr:C-type mannose receptor 2-like [Acanthopagrus latus]